MELNHLRYGMNLNGSHYLCASNIHTTQDNLVDWDRLSPTSWMKFSASQPVGGTYGLNLEGIKGCIMCQLASYNKVGKTKQRSSFYAIVTALY